jgi:hypothetical protein
MDTNSLPKVKFLTSESDSIAESMIPDFLDNLDSLQDNIDQLNEQRYQRSNVLKDK